MSKFKVHVATVEGKHGTQFLGVFGTPEEAQSAIDTYDDWHYIQDISEWDIDLTERSADTVRVPRELVRRSHKAMKSAAHMAFLNGEDDAMKQARADADALAAILAGKGEG